MGLHTNLTRRYQEDRLPVTATHAFGPRSDLTFRTIDNLTLEGQNFHQSLFNGCLIRHCSFRNVRLSRCDLEQIQLQNSSFENCSFENVELTSGQIAQTRFISCDFESALISDCTWSDCTIEKCSFQQAVIHLSQFERCRLAGNSFRGASVQLDTFRQSLFENEKLGDCTFLNHIISSCSFKHVSINAESLGSLFGISESDLASFSLIHLGEQVVDVAKAEHLLDTLIKDYERRRWYFMAEVLRLNFNYNPRVTALDACLKALLWPGSCGAPLKMNDIVFLEMIVVELFRQRRFPALSALTFPQQIRSFQQHANIATAEQSRLQQLTGRLQTVLIELLQELEPTIVPLVKRDGCRDVKLVFAKKPHTDVIEFLKIVGDCMPDRISRHPKKLEERNGSYLLYVQAALLTLAAFQIALWLLNGCVGQIIELKARMKIATQKSPKVIRQRVLLPDQNVPKWMVIPLQSIFSKLTGNAERLKQTALDFDSANLSQVEILPDYVRKRKRTPSKKS